MADLADPKRFGIHKCQLCEKEFYPKAKDRIKYCSRECAYIDIDKWYCKTKKIAKAKAPAKTQHNKSCVICNGAYKSSYPNAKYCSVKCRIEPAKYKMKSPSVFVCIECDAHVSSQYGDKRQVFCSDTCARKHGRRTAKAVRRARCNGSEVIESINPYTVFIKHKWTCAACGCDTPKAMRGTMDGCAPELDHIVPLSRGGAHTDDNLQLLCRDCNQLKSGLMMYEFINKYIQIGGPSLS